MILYLTNNYKMPINPQTISYLLSLCPICEDIQYKILMLVIGMNGTPTSLSIKIISNKMKIYYTKIKHEVLDQPLIRYCGDLSLFNYLTALYPEYCYQDEDVDEDVDEAPDEHVDADDYYNPYEKTKPYIPSFLYDILIANDLYSSIVDDDIVNEYKQATKVRLNKMIEEGKPYNI